MTVPRGSASPAAAQGPVSTGRFAPAASAVNPYSSGTLMDWKTCNLMAVNTTETHIMRTDTAELHREADRTVEHTGRAYRILAAICSFSPTAFCRMIGYQLKVGIASRASLLVPGMMIFA
jgi:hypothetical protein